MQFHSKLTMYTTTLKVVGSFACLSEEEKAWHENAGFTAALLNLMLLMVTFWPLPCACKQEVLSGRKQKQVVGFVIDGTIMLLSHTRLTTICLSSAIILKVVGSFVCL